MVSSRRAAEALKQRVLPTGLSSDLAALRTGGLDAGMASSAEDSSHTSDEATDTVCYVARLPTELLDTIFQHLFDNIVSLGQSPPVVSGFFRRQIVPTCRTWRAVALPFGWRDLDFGIQPTALTKYGSLARSLKVHFDFEADTADDVLQKFHAIQACHRVRRLWIRLQDGWNQLDQSALRMGPVLAHLREPSAHRLTELEHVSFDIPSTWPDDPFGQLWEAISALCGRFPPSLELIKFVDYSEEPGWVARWVRWVQEVESLHLS